MAYYISVGWNENDNWFGGYAINKFFPWYLKFKSIFTALIIVCAHACTSIRVIRMLRLAGSKPQSTSAPLHSDTSPSCQSSNNLSIQRERWLAIGGALLLKYNLRLLLSQTTFLTSHDALEHDLADWAVLLNLAPNFLLRSSGQGEKCGSTLLTTCKNTTDLP